VEPGLSSAFKRKQRLPGQLTAASIEGSGGGVNL